MLSILIPVFNYDCRNLVYELHKQISELKIDFEILVIDDCSSNEKLKHVNSEISQLDNVRIVLLSQNIGYSKIRNLLAEESKYDSLLFLDSDCKIIDKEFIYNFLPFLNSNKVICGGMVYSEYPPEKRYLLKWLHGKKREEISAKERNKNPYRTFWAGNFCIRKKDFNKVKFDEKSSKYGYNDTMFGLRLKMNNILVEHKDISCLHDTLIENQVFIQKNLTAVENLVYYEKQFKLYKKKYRTFIRVYGVYYYLKMLFLSNLFYKFYTKNKSNWISNLNSEKPKLLYLDLLKLGKFIEIKKSCN